MYSDGSSNSSVKKKDKIFRKKKAIKDEVGVSKPNNRILGRYFWKNS